MTRSLVRSIGAHLAACSKDVISPLRPACAAAKNSASNSSYMTFCLWRQFLRATFSRAVQRRRSVVGHES